MSLSRFQRGVRQLGMGAGSRLARPPAVLPEPDIRPGGHCPVFAGTGLPAADITMSQDGSTIYVGASRDWDAYSWPALSLTGTGTISGGDLTDWVMDALLWSKVEVDGKMWAINAGYDTTLVVQDYHGVMIRTDPTGDGSTTELIAEFGDFLSAHTALDWRLTWHPADPDGLWFLERVDDAAELKRFDMSSTAITTAVTGMDASGLLGTSIRQYPTGLVWSTQATGDDPLIHAYDIVSVSHDSVSSASELTGVGYSAERIYVGTAATLQAIDISTSGAVSLDGPHSVECSAFTGPGYDVEPSEWFAPESRSVVYVSDSFAWFDVT